MQEMIEVRDLNALMQEVRCHSCQASTVRPPFDAHVPASFQ